MAAAQATSMAADRSLSRASSLPQLNKKRRQCFKNDLFALNAHLHQFSVERVFSLDYVLFHLLSRLVAGLRFFILNEALACGFHPLLSGSQVKV
jgi:hypothetical protein